MIVVVPLLYGGICFYHCQISGAVNGDTKRRYYSACFLGTYMHIICADQSANYIVGSNYKSVMLHEGNNNIAQRYF